MNPTQTITAAELATEIQTPVPTLAPTAPTPTSASPGAEITPAPTETDALGRAFDATKFAPRKDSRGRWINKNAGRKPGSAAAAAVSGKSFVAPDPQAPAVAGVPQSDRYDLAAEMYCRAGYSVLDGVFSADGEWLPENDSEHVALKTSLATYLRHKQSDDLPPGPAMALALATYSAKRLTKPRTMTRLRLFIYWAKSTWYSFRTGRKLDGLPSGAPAPLTEQSPLPPAPSPAATAQIP